jgi:hypothetical protein
MSYHISLQVNIMYTQLLKQMFQNVHFHAKVVFYKIEIYFDNKFFNQNTQHKK